MLVEEVIGVIDDAVIEAVLESAAAVEVATNKEVVAAQAEEVGELGVGGEGVLACG